jgi:hypothetical protein
MSEKTFVYDKKYPATIWVRRLDNDDDDSWIDADICATEKDVMNLSDVNGTEVAQYERVCISKVESKIVPRDEK